MNLKIIIFIIALFNCITVGLFAQQVSVKSLEECIKFAMDNNLTLKSGRISIERAKDMQSSAFEFEKTMLSLSQDPTSGGGGNDNSWSIGQSFEFPTVYSARRNLLKAETDLERRRLEVSENELIREVSSVYYNLLYAKKYVNILNGQDSIYGKFRRMAAIKLELGESGRLELINAERLYNENKIELKNAESDYHNIQIELQKWLNTDLMIEPDEKSLNILTFIPVKYAASQTPFGRIYEDRLKVSEKNLSLQRQEFLPNFNFTLYNQFLISGFNPYNIQRERFDKGNFMGFEVGLGIPLFFGGQLSKTKAAKREVEIIRTEQELALLSLQKEFETRLNEYYKAKTGLDYYLKTGNKLAAEIESIAQIAYEKGEIGYMEYIQNLKAAVEIHVQYINAVNAYNQSIIVLNYLYGNQK